MTISDLMDTLFIQIKTFYLVQFLAQHWWSKIGIYATYIKIFCFVHNKAVKNMLRSLFCFMVGPLSLIHCRWISHLYNKNDLCWKNNCSSQPRKFLWSTAGLKWNWKNYYLTYFTIQTFSWSLDIKLVLHFSDLVVSSQLSFLLLSLPLRAY